MEVMDQIELIKLIRTDRYFERYYEILPECPTKKAAWLRLESEIFSDEPDYWRYKTYESFRVSLSNYLKRLQLRGENILLQKRRKTKTN